MEARCPACRAARAQVHHHPAGLSLPLITAALLALLLIMLALHVVH